MRTIQKGGGFGFLAWVFCEALTFCDLEKVGLPLNTLTETNAQDILGTINSRIAGSSGRCEFQGY